jgi:carbamate kinase
MMTRRFNEDTMLVVTLGGNAVLPAGTAGTIDEQFQLTRSTMKHVAALRHAGVKLVVSHGNGPVVGNIVIRNEAARDLVPPMPLFVCGADSQGGMGFMIQNALRNELHLIGDESPVATVVTQVEVDPADPAFAAPTKPIGPFFPPAEAERLAREKGWVMREDAGRGIRRVVASPEPRHIVEIASIRTLVSAGVLTIAAGGGGIPVRRNREGLLKGIDAVIDKDRAAALLARELGATHLIFVTGVDREAVGWGTPGQRDLEGLSLAELKGYYAAGEFPPGSMGPKMQAAIRFLEQGGREVLVCSPETLGEALAGRAGTLITP